MSITISSKSVITVTENAAAGVAVEPSHALAHSGRMHAFSAIPALHRLQNSVHTAELKAPGRPMTHRTSPNVTQIHGYVGLLPRWGRGIDHVWKYPGCRICVSATENLLLSTAGGYYRSRTSNRYPRSLVSGSQ